MDAIAIKDGECYEEYVCRLLRYLVGLPKIPQLLWGTGGLGVNLAFAEKYAYTPNRLHTITVYSDAVSAKTVIMIEGNDAYVLPPGGPWTVDFLAIAETTRIGIRGTATESGKYIWVTVS